MKSPDELARYLRARGLLPEGPVEVRRLTGGVSSALDVFHHAGGAFVVKQALEKLLVADDWHADPARNRSECAYFRRAATIPGASAHVPAILHEDADAGLFVMEYLAGDWRTWKAALLAGETSAASARLVGAFLGAMHEATWQDETTAAEFATTHLFEELRIAPYLRTTAERQPAVAPFILAEAERLAACREALVHGDYSPKNLLVQPGALKVLDAEVAWFGDPAFDVAFLANHLLLKAVRFGPFDAFATLVTEFLGAYLAAFPRRSDDLEARAVRLQLMLMLARLWGKSPVEYLTRDEPPGPALTDLLVTTIPAPPATFAEWTATLRARFSA